jgi:hypothetical protein
MAHVGTTIPEWQAVGAVAPRHLQDARLQAHHAVQIAVAAAISYLRHEPDDSHTSLTWSRHHRSLLTQPIPAPNGAFRIGFRPAGLLLFAVSGADAVQSTFALGGRTVRGAYRWLSEVAEHAGLEAHALTAKRHYEIPPHLVADGAVFVLGDGEDFLELERYWTDAASVLEPIAASTPDSSPVRCWPHHFDIATLLGLPHVAGAPARTIGIGLSPGDDSYDEPYFYVGPYPYPDAAKLPLLPIGHWHTERWMGGVLTATELAAASSGTDQRERVTGFIDAAAAACRALLTPR